ncbi:MAG: chemotaxis-specific protein-glutamate methyltransferase CheB [Burkholderiaceae bacterium]|nr:chemotaxis-specific protein-glutamate methyltransferase CheB [Burkholderiaceae bacterium]
MIKLLIVDDSALMRRQLAQLFEAEGDFDVRIARNGREAIEENRNYLPDVVTLDINMPEMDGLTALSELMLDRPVPVVMLSSLTGQGALATFEALNLGAVDYMPKPGGTISLSIDTIRRDLVDKVRCAARVRVRPQRTRLAPAVAPAATPAPRVPKTATARVTGRDDAILLIGVSTGGPRTLEYILPHLPADFPMPVLVAQHMPASFTLPFAQRMDGLCQMRVVEASAPMALEPGTVYIGKGGADMVVVRRAGRPTVMARPEDPGHLWHPSVELMARSTLEVYDPAKVTAVMLTGMGYDGAEAFAEIRRRGGRTIAESEESAVVFGMPAELISRGGATLVLPAERIATQINAWFTH